MKKYIIVTTICNDLNNANRIIDLLLEKRIIVGSQISEIYSKYWWNNYLEESKEYKIEFRTKLSKFNEIEKIIKENHTYKVAEISYQEINGSKEFLEWIDKFVED